MGVLTRRVWRLALPLLLSIASLPALASAQAPSAADLARGKYIFGATGGCGCHTVPKQAANAGGRRYDGAFGTVYSSRLGRRANGERLIPVHPYTVFNGMSADDLKALVAFLRSVPPVKRANQPKKISVPMFESVFLPAWLAAFAPRENPPTSAPTAGVARGEYLVRAVGHCGECHTPRTMTMATDNTRFLAGNPKGPEDSEVPNITSDKTTGLQWSEEEIADYLATGNKPDGDVAGGLMGEVIEGTLAGYKDLTKADRLAIAQYLKTIPPIKNKIGK